MIFLFWLFFSRSRLMFCFNNASLAPGGRREKKKGDCPHSVHFRLATYVTLIGLLTL
jgi:hypothetical protein